MNTNKSVQVACDSCGKSGHLPENVVFVHTKELPGTNVAGFDTTQQSAKVNLSTGHRIPRGLHQKIKEQKVQTTTVYSHRQFRGRYLFYCVTNTETQDVSDAYNYLDDPTLGSIMIVYLIENV